MALSVIMGNIPSEKTRIMTSPAISTPCVSIIIAVSFGEYVLCNISKHNFTLFFKLPQSKRLIAKNCKGTWSSTVIHVFDYNTWCKITIQIIRWHWPIVNMLDL